MLTSAAHTQKLSPKPVTSTFLHCYCPITSHLHLWTGQLNSLSTGLSAFIHFFLFKELKWLQNHKSDHVVSLLLTLIASPFIIKLKTPALVYQVLYDLTPGPLSHLLYSLLVFCWLHFSPVGLLHSPLRTCSFALKGKCCSLDTFWSLLKCHFLRETIPNTLFTVAPLSACLLSLQQHSSPAGITQLKRYLINNGLEFSKWAMEEEHSKKRRGSMWCMSECP